MAACRFNTVVDKRLLAKMAITMAGTLGSLLTTLVAMGTQRGVEGAGAEGGGGGGNASTAAADG